MTTLPSAARRCQTALDRSTHALAVIVLFACLLLWPAASQAQIKAVVRPGATPAWDKGMQAITSESYYHAIECGKQGGDDPPCVFWDTGLCKNDDFTLMFYSGYKQVAFEVWTAVRKKLPPPQPAPAPVHVYVFTDARGEGDELAARRDSVKDLRGALGDKKGLAIVADEDAAQVSVEVGERTTTIPRFAVGTTMLPGQRPGMPGAAAPMRDVHLHVKLRWRDVVLVLTNKKSPVESGGGWTTAAKDIATQIATWVADHRSEIVQAP